MNRRVKIGIMVALLLLAVGFAAITTTLIINGTLSIGPDSEGFDAEVVFTSAKTNGKAFITENGKTIQFTADLMDIGEEADLKYEITNKNRQYDASGVIECDFVDENNSLNEYITITPSPDTFEIEASRKKTGHVIVRMIKSFIGTATSDVGEIEFKCTIRVDASERDSLAPEVVPVYTDATLNGADPTVGGDLIPVVIADDGTVTYADLYEDWYDYSNKRWANAVILKDGQSFIYDEGDIIDEDDIETYFVWIPRYRYKLWNVDATNVVDSELPESNNARTIEIVFETKDVEASVGTQNGEWLTHPAFTAFDVDGIWVGKYGTSVKDVESYNNGTYINGIKPEMVSIKPNGWFWRNNKIGGMFKTSYQYNRALDSHMMKNTEWGAVAYLSHSEFGIDGEVRINNFTLGSAGYSSSIEPTCYSTARCNNWVNNTTAGKTYAYNTDIGYLASTTGNITGVYDMSGGFEEYVAAYVEGGVLTNLQMSASELEDYSKYLDVYSSTSTSTSYENRILGDATGEMGPFYYFADDDSTSRTHNNWYSDLSTFVDPSYSFFIRGGGSKYGTLGGQFTFSAGNGANSSGITFRVVLAPQ